MIPYGRQDISQEDVNAVVEVLRSEYLTQGPVVPNFENCVASHVSAKHAIAVNSATSALHIACLALGLGAGDWLWTSPITFVASANCGLYCGAKIDFVDIDPKTNNICVVALEKKLKRASIDGNLPKILIPVHLSGLSCDMESIHKLSVIYNFKVIEDASHAIGGKYKGNYIGSCKYSDITVFSFHPVKIITTCEGGMALTNSFELASKMQLLRSHGITRDESCMTMPSEGPWYYQQICLGFNYRMTELQAALGLSQMTRLDSFVDRRIQLAKRYDKALQGMPVLSPMDAEDSSSSHHLYIIRLKLNEIQNSHKVVFEMMRKMGVAVNLHYIPVHHHPYYKDMGFKDDEFPAARQYYKEAISLPIYPGLTDVMQDKVIEVLQKAIG